MTACEYVHPDDISRGSRGKLLVIADEDHSVIEGDTVELDYVANTISNWSHQWQQLSGPTVTIIDSTLSTARFVAPPVISTTAFTFRVTVKSLGRKSSDDVTVFVEPMSATSMRLQAPLYRQLEAEPNDSLQTASALFFPNAVSTEPPAADVKGSIHSSGGDANDFFVFTPQDTGDYHVYLCNDPVVCTRGTVSEDWNLLVYDQNFMIVANTNPGRIYERKLMLRLDAGLTYYVGVKSWNAASESWQYSLTIVRD